MTQQAYLAVLVVIILTVLILISRWLDKKPRYQKIEHLLSSAELEFYHQLTQLLPEYAVMCQVGLSSLFRVDGKKHRQASFNKIQSKHFDFVVIDPQSSKILVAIELDDSSHSRPDRVSRDKFVNQIAAEVGLKLVRYRPGDMPTREGLGV